MQSIERDAAAAAILAVVGDGMAGMPGGAAQVLRRARSGRHQRARDRAGRVGAQHLRGHRREATARARAPRRARSFYLSAQTISIGVLGPGLVGGALLDQIARAGERAARDGSTSICACARSPAAKKMTLEPQRIDLDHWRDALAAGQPLDAVEIRRPRAADHLPHSVLDRLHREPGGRRPLRRVARPRASTWSRRTSARTAGRSRTTRTSSA